MIVDKLQQIGFTEKEASIYLSGLSCGAVRVSELAKIANLNRTTTYQVLEDLVKKGLAVWGTGERGKRIRVNSPESINDYLESQRKKLEQNRLEVKDIISELNLKFIPEESETKVLYYRGHRGSNEMLWQMLKNLSNNSTVYGYANLSWTGSEGDWFTRKQRAEMLKRNIKDMVISFETKDLEKWIVKERDRIKKMGYNKGPVVLRILPSKKFFIETDYYIMEKEIAYYTFGENKEPLGIRIINKPVAQTARAIFKNVWQLAKPIKIYNLGGNL